MHFSAFIFACIAAATAVRAVPAAPAPSGTPCLYTSCPALDQLGFTLGDSTQDAAAGTVMCSYPAVPGENDADFYCTYNTATGHLATDHDAGFCVPLSAQHCDGKRRDVAGIYAAYQRQVSKRAAAPVPAPRPQFMNTRAVLGQRKLLSRRAL